MTVWYADGVGPVMKYVDTPEFLQNLRRALQHPSVAGSVDESCTFAVGSDDPGPSQNCQHFAVGELLVLRRQGVNCRRDHGDVRGVDPSGHVHRSREHRDIHGIDPRTEEGPCLLGFGGHVVGADMAAPHDRNAHISDPGGKTDRLRVMEYNEIALAEPVDQVLGVGSHDIAPPPATRGDRHRLGRVFISCFVALRRL